MTTAWAAYAAHLDRTFGPHVRAAAVVDALAVVVGRTLAAVAATMGAGR